MTITYQRPTKTIILFVLCFFAVWSLRATYFYSIDESLASDAHRIIYSTVIKILLWVVPAMGYAVWKQRARPFQYLGITVMPSGRQWFWSLVVTGLFLGAVIGFETLLGGKTLSTAGITVSFAISDLLFTFVSPWLEEILFRGLFLKEFAKFLPGWAANVLTSLLFVGIHLPFWMSRSGLNQVVIANSVGVFIFSLFAGWLYLKSSSIWPPTLAHIANNWLGTLLVINS